MARLSSAVGCLGVAVQGDDTNHNELGGNGVLAHDTQFEL